MIFIIEAAPWLLSREYQAVRQMLELDCGWATGLSKEHCFGKLQVNLSLETLGNSFQNQ